MFQQNRRSLRIEGRGNSEVLQPNGIKEFLGHHKVRSPLRTEFRVYSSQLDFRHAPNLQSFQAAPGKVDSRWRNGFNKLH